MDWLSIFIYKESVLLLALKMKNVGNSRLGWSDQERHGSGEAEVKDWLPIKIPHCTLSIVLYPGSAACSGVESGIEPMGDAWVQF